MVGAWISILDDYTWNIRFLDVLICLNEMKKHLNCISTRHTWGIHKMSHARWIKPYIRGTWMIWGLHSKGQFIQAYDSTFRFFSLVTEILYLYQRCRTKRRMQRIIRGNGLGAAVGLLTNTPPLIDGTSDPFSHQNASPLNMFILTLQVFNIFLSNLDFAIAWTIHYY